jgi:hypothetical protein
MAGNFPPPLPTWDAVAAEATKVLEAHWSPDLRCTLPHAVAYPHRWLWDSCFHVIAWASLGRPEAGIELESLLASRLATGVGRGFLPHMVYGAASRNGNGINRGMLRGMSSFTQPPVYALALTALLESGVEPVAWLLPAVTEALRWLWGARLDAGLLTIVHPWESGADISPRFDDWYGSVHFDRLDEDYDRLVETTSYDEAGVATSNSVLVVAPSAFNGIAADAARRIAALTGDRAWSVRQVDLQAQIDEQLWDDRESLWVDRAIHPGGAARSGSSSGLIPTLDGVLGALGSTSGERAQRALGQCVGSGRFAAPFGPRYLPADHRLYRPNVYWRGPAWPQLNFLLIEAARRHGLEDIADELTETTLRGVWASGFSEYWNPETGEGRGATPQSWSAVAVALRP